MSRRQRLKDSLQTVTYGITEEQREKYFDALMSDNSDSNELLDNVESLAQDNVSCQRFGYGPNHVVMIHDLICSSREYLGLFDYLNIEDFTYTLIDLRGYGLSQGVKGKFTLDEITGDILKFLDFLKIEKCHLVGHSMSGIFTQKFAVEHPERVLSLTGVCPTMASGYPGNDEIYNQVVAMFATKETRYMMLQHILGNRYSEEWIQFKASEWNELTQPEAVEGYFSAINTARFLEQALEIRQPHQMLAGEFDHPPFDEKSLKESPYASCSNVTIEKIAGSGHYPMQETPVLLATKLNTFLRKHTPSLAKEAEEKGVV